MSFFGHRLLSIFDLGQIDLGDTKAAQRVSVSVVAATVGKQQSAVARTEDGRVAVSAGGIVLNGVQLAKGAAVIETLAQNDGCASPGAGKHLATVIAGNGIVNGIKTFFGC